MKALLSKDGSIWLDFPLVVQEIGFESFIDLRAKEQAFFKANTKPSVDDENAAEAREIRPEDQAEAEVKPQMSADELQAFYEQSQTSIEHLFDVLETVCSGSLDVLPLSIGKEDQRTLFAAKFHYNKDNVFKEPMSLLRLYCHVVQIINKYKPEDEDVGLDFSITWKGEDYFIDPTETFKVLNGVDYTAGEALTVLDFRKRAQEKLAEKGDDEGNISFNLGLQEVACLLRKKGEKLPHRRRERIRFIDNRKATFRDLPLDVILGVRFFFLHILKNYKTTRRLNSSLRVQRMKLKASKNHAIRRGVKRKRKKRGK